MPEPISLLTLGVGAAAASATWAGVAQTHRKNQKKAERLQDVLSGHPPSIHHRVSDHRKRDLAPVGYGMSTTRMAGAQNGGRVEYRADGSVSVWGSQPGDRAFSSETTNFTPMVMSPGPMTPFGQPLARPTPPMSPCPQPPFGYPPVASPPPQFLPSPYPMGGPCGGYAPLQIQAAPAQHYNPYGAPPPSYEQSEKRHHSSRRWNN